MGFDFIPLTPSETNYRLLVPLDEETFSFDVRWNSRDAAFYIDIRQDDETPIALGLKLVLGAPIGRHCTHPFFVEHFLKMIDSTDSGLDATFDDIGDRVVLLHLSRKSLFAAGDASQ